MRAESPLGSVMQPIVPIEDVELALLAGQPQSPASAFPFGFQY